MSAPLTLRAWSTLHGSLSDVYQGITVQGLLTRSQINSDLEEYVFQYLSYLPNSARYLSLFCRRVDGLVGVALPEDLEEPGMDLELLTERQDILYLIDFEDELLDRENALGRQDPARSSRDGSITYPQLSSTSLSPAPPPRRYLDAAGGGTRYLPRDPREGLELEGFIDGPPPGRTSSSAPPNSGFPQQQRSLGFSLVQMSTPQAPRRFNSRGIRNDVSPPRSRFPPVGVAFNIFENAIRRDRRRHHPDEEEGVEDGFEDGPLAGRNAPQDPDSLQPPRRPTVSHLSPSAQEARRQSDSGFWYSLERAEEGYRDGPSPGRNALEDSNSVQAARRPAISHSQSSAQLVHRQPTPFPEGFPDGVEDSFADGPPPRRFNNPGTLLYTDELLGSPQEELPPSSPSDQRTGPTPPRGGDLALLIQNRIEAHPDAEAGSEIEDVERGLDNLEIEDTGMEGVKPAGAPSIQVDAPAGETFNLVRQSFREPRLDPR